MRLKTVLRPVAFSIIMGLYGVATLPAAENKNPPADSGKWQVVWSEEFNGTAVDTTVWNYELRGDHLGIAAFKPENIWVANGNLVIEVKKESYSYDLGPRESVPVAKPVIRPAAGAYTGTVMVSLNCYTDSAAIYYTTDGSSPTSGSIRYKGPFTLTSNALIKALAVRPGMADSKTDSAAYTVTKDTEGPKITTVAAIGTTAILIGFNEPLDPGSVTAPGNYRVKGIKVTAVALDSIARTVELTTSSMSVNTTYPLTVSGIKDMAPKPNTMAKATVQYTCTAGLADDFEAGGKLAWKPKNAENWRLDSDGDDMSYHMHTIKEYGGLVGEYSLSDGGNIFGGFELQVDVRTQKLSQYANFGVLFGFVDPGNYYWLMGNAFAEFSELFKVTNVKRASLCKYNESFVPDSAYHTIKVRVFNGAVTIYKDGVKKQTAEVPGIPAGSVGLCSGNAPTFFDNFRIMPLTGTTVNPLPPARLSAPVQANQWGHRNRSNHFEYTSASITTQRKKSFQYGKFEMRAKLPRGNAVWPAFWTMGDTFRWPQCGEIDIFELWGGSAEGLDDKIWSTFHWQDTAGVHLREEHNYQLPEGIFADQYHVFGLEWNVAGLNFLLDGVKYASVEMKPEYRDALHQKHYLLIDLAIQAAQPGYAVDDAVLPQKMYIDWVRVSQLKP